MKHRDDACDYLPEPGEDGYAQDVRAMYRRAHARRRKSVRGRRAIHDGVSTLM